MSTFSTINESYPYPTSWPSIATPIEQDGCPNVAGNYENQGLEWSPLNGANTSTISEVFRLFMFASEIHWPSANKVVIPADVASVAIAQKANLIEVAFTESNGRQTAVELQQFLLATEVHTPHIKKFQCDVYESGSGLRLMTNFNQSRSSSSLGIAGSDTFAIFFKAADGSLILRWQVQSANLSVFIAGSYLRNESSWTRFRPISATGQ